MKCKKINLFIVFSLLLFNAFGQEKIDSSYHFRYSKSQSGLAVLVKVAAKIFLPKNTIQSKIENENYSSSPAKIPNKIKSKLKIDTFLVSGQKVYQFEPKNNSSKKTVLFLHGGGYVNNIFRQHWIFCAKLVEKTNCRIIIPDYPLAPKSNYLDAFSMLDTIYQNLLKETDVANIILMGDSAGGGLAMAFAQKLKIKNQPQANQLILIAPWLDVTMSNPDIELIQKKDPVLHAPVFIPAGAKWAGNSSTKNPLISPIYGSVDGLGKISIFIGTHDILLADCKILKKNLEQKNIVFNYFEYPKMLHDWVMYIPMKESRFSINQIAKLILN
jgi:acetyl esterase/lipase